MNPGPMPISKLEKELEADFGAKVRQPVLAALKLLGLRNPEERVQEGIEARGHRSRRRFPSKSAYPKPWNGLIALPLPRHSQ
jgi:hypothetical protein